MDPASPDTRLANYRLERLLGAGGMGSVHLARDLALDRQVAIKFISADRAADPGARRRLLREARAAAALEHPNICVIHEVIDDPGGSACIVMQYVEGETLAARLKRGAIDVRFALSVVSDIASALSLAHRHGIVHRDIKPQNIILTPDGPAKLLDFGLAVQGGGMTDGGETTVTHLTTPGMVAGTPGYMSPEQADGRALDARSDLFSLGCVLYECLTGQRPFRSSLAADPAPPSALRDGLTPAHDELVLRLLERRPEDRFRSADELLGALGVLATGDTRPSAAREAARAPWRLRRSHAAAVICAVLVLLAGFAAWRGTGAEWTPSDPRAAEWYRRGTDAIRDGAPHSARLALTEAISAAPEFVPAYIRLAEAQTELDETERAQETLLRAVGLVGTGRLDAENRMRIDAVRALMLRDPDEAIRAYRQIAEARAGSPDVWLDLGRAQDAFSLASDARASFDRAIQIDSQYAAAHLRRGAILALQGERGDALAAFIEAERLYRAASNTEGEVETLLRRGIVLNSAGELRSAREALQRAIALAGPLENRAQLIRGQLTLSSVIASEGQWAEAEQIATAAVNEALRDHLETVAAEGLVDLASVLMQRGKTAEAQAHLRRAIDLAEERRAYRVVARAKLQQAFIVAESGRPAEAIAAAQWPLEFFRAKKFTSFELIALAIISRAYEALGRYDLARPLSEQALAASRAIGDKTQEAHALENLGGQANAVGDLASAARYRERGLAIHRAQNDTSALGFDLLNRADLLIRLGRHAEALPLLDEIDEGAARGLEAFVPRARRALTWRAVSAAIERRPAEIRDRARRLLDSAPETPDFSAQLAAVLIRYANAIERRGSRDSSLPELLGSSSSTIGRELRYWQLTTLLAQADPRALPLAEQTLAAEGATRSYEFEWRIAAIGAAAARELKLADRQQTLLGRSANALDRLRREWKDSADTYEARPDLVELRRKAGLGSRP